jgi:hypothetical protein
MKQRVQPLPIAARSPIARSQTQPRALRVKGLEQNFVEPGAVVSGAFCDARHDALRDLVDYLA